jgi:hypothetical protein
MLINKPTGIYIYLYYTEVVRLHVEFSQSHTSFSNAQEKSIQNWNVQSNRYLLLLLHHISTFQ